MNAEQKIITIIIIIALLTLGFGVLIGYSLGIQSLDSVDFSAYWTGYSHACVQHSTLPEDECYSIVETQVYSLNAP